MTYNISQQQAKERIFIKRALRKMGIVYKMDESTKGLKAKIVQTNAIIFKK